MSKPPRIGPMPGWVTMSTNTMPPPWFSAANMSREKRIDRICDFGGSRPPRKPSTRIVAPGPAISFSTRSISSGSSGSASICDFDSTVLKRSLFGSDAAVAGSRPTETALVELLDREHDFSTCVAGAQPEIRHADGLEAGEAHADAVPSRHEVLDAARIPAHRSRRRSARAAAVRPSAPADLTIAPGITAPLGSLTTTRRRAVSGRVWASDGRRDRRRASALTTSASDR